MLFSIILVITNPFCAKVNPALGAPLATVPLLKVNHPFPLSHHTVQTVGGRMDTNLGFRTLCPRVLEVAHLQRNWSSEGVLAEPNIAEELTILNLDQVDQVVCGEGEPSWGRGCHLGGGHFTFLKSCTECNLVKAVVFIEQLTAAETILTLYPKDLRSQWNIPLSSKQKPGERTYYSCISIEK